MHGLLKLFSNTAHKLTQTYTYTLAYSMCIYVYMYVHIYIGLTDPHNVHFNNVKLLSGILSLDS